MRKHIKPSPAFKANAIKTIVSIVLFAATYLFILLLAVGLTVLCVVGGIWLVITFPRLIILVLGIGLASMGFLILIFLLKFIFTSHKVDRSHLVEVTKEDEPRLFQMIDDIVTEVKTEFPKKVYLSSEVNASVFYDSNFWSMFLPIKKNLQIGLGLVNTVTEIELKAILSHEFGHFSQRTMKVGSYVYNVNQIIFNMLYDNDSYQKLIQGWTEVSGYFSIFVVIAGNINEGIQWVLKQLYGVVNKSYMGLSREMEFHADEIAASVTGYEPLKNSLLRMTLADNAFQSVINFYERKIEDNQKSDNIFQEHLFVLNFMAKNNNIPVVHYFPNVTEESLNKFNKSRLIIEDQWASHPSTEDRIKRLEETNLSSEQKNDIPANIIFRDIEATQRKLTSRMFHDVEYKSEVTHLSLNTFKKEYESDHDNNSFSDIYNGYYDHKNPALFDPGKAHTSGQELTLDELFSDNKIELVYISLALQNDIETLKRIAYKSLRIKTFDYDGKKYTQEKSNELLIKLQSQLKELNERIQRNDMNVFHYFKSCELKQQQKDKKLEVLYKEYFDFDREFDSKFELYTKLSDDLQFVNFQTSFEQIKTNFEKIRSVETKLKINIKVFLEDQKYQSELSKEMRENFELYLSKEWDYFLDESYIEDNLTILFTALNSYSYLLSRGYFLTKKNLLDYQVELVDPSCLNTQEAILPGSSN